MIRLRAEVPAQDHEAFLEAAQEAFGYPLDRHLNSLVCQAYAKMSKHKADSFLSSNALADARRGRPRPRRNRTGRRAKSMPPYEGRVPAWVQIPEWAARSDRQVIIFSPRIVSIGRRETTMDGAVHGRKESRVLGAANQWQHRRVQAEFDVAESRPGRRRRQGFAAIFGEALGREERDGREFQRLHRSSP